jgi:RimJ/RimL family protein N-acetyltransferase
MLKLMEDLVLSGQFVRLEPLELQHRSALLSAADSGGELYQWSPVPKTEADVERYIETALAWKQAGTAMPFVIVRQADGAVIGSTRFWNIEYWGWPPAHERFGRGLPDACEIGYTWLTPSAIRTPANTEAKKLLLEHAFENWKVLRVCLHTDVRNERSRRAIERIGGRFEGVLRAHRIAADYTARDSARFSILAAEWPAAKERLRELLERR